MPHIPATVQRVDSWSRIQAFVVRPDGYIGYRGPVSQLGSWFDLVNESTPTLEVGKTAEVDCLKRITVTAWSALLTERYPAAESPTPRDL